MQFCEAYTVKLSFFFNRRNALPRDDSKFQVNFVISIIYVSLSLSLSPFGLRRRGKRYSYYFYYLFYITCIPRTYAVLK